MDEHTPDYLQHIRPEDLLRVSSEIIATRNVQVDRMRKRIRTLETLLLEGRELVVRSGLHSPDAAAWVFDVNEAVRRERKD